MRGPCLWPTGDTTLSLDRPERAATQQLQLVTEARGHGVLPANWTCVGLAFLHIALPECFWFGNLLTEAVWHHSQILLTHTVDFTLLLTPSTSHRALLPFLCLPVSAGF